MKPFRIELSTDFTAGPANAYLFTEPEPVLIDTGVKNPESWLELEKGLAERRLKVADLAKVVITHPHVDHFGQAAGIAAQSNAEIWVSEVAKPWVVDFQGMWVKRIAYYRDAFLEGIGFPAETAEMILTFMENVMSSCDSVPESHLSYFKIDGTIEMGGMAWQVVYAPGHTHYQTCFFQPESRQFISADMLLSRTPTPIVERPESGVQRVPALPRFLDSLDRIEAMDIEWVYPGHGEPFSGHRALIQHQRQRIHKRKEECLAHIERGVCRPTDLLNTMYAHIPLHQRFVGLWMLVGYLDLLKAEGRITETTVDGVWHYHKEGG